MADRQSPVIPNPSVIVPVNPVLEDCMRSLTGSTDHSVLTEMENYAKQYNSPIVDRLAGVFLETLAKTINARRVFEFGSGYGYSAYWFTHG